jgi:peptide deformylase
MSTRPADRGKTRPTEKLRVFGDPVLKQSCREVVDFDKHLEKLVAVMFDIMKREEGVGLAAPQIGLLKRITVWRHPEDEEQRFVFVNPTIVAHSEETTTESEACLSVPGVSMQVERADEVVVEAQDLKGQSFQMRITGYLARIVQHEVDHLEGRLILDRTTVEERRRVLKEYRERTLAGES